MSGRDSYSRRTFLGRVGAVGAALSVTGGTAAASKGKPPTPTKSVTVHEGLEYADREGGPPLELDLYLPDSDEPAPLVVWLHGGGWLVGNRKSSPDLERYFASRGYAMATVEYRLSDASVVPPEEWILPPSAKQPRGTFPDQIVDVKAAIRWLRSKSDEYDLDPENVATWGSSAGAHLAALAGTAGDVQEIAGDVYPPAAVEKDVAPDESGEVQAVVDWYGPTDFLQMDPQLDGAGFQHNSLGSPESILIGEQITEAPEKVERADPITYVDSDDPPFMIMHGREDTTVPYEQSEILYEALKENCVDATFYELHDLGHGFGFEELLQKPVIDQTVSETQCRTTAGRESPPRDRTSSGPPAGHKVIEQFLDQSIGH